MILVWKRRYNGWSSYPTYVTLYEAPCMGLAMEWLAVHRAAGTNYYLYDTTYSTGQWTNDMESGINRRALEASI